MGLYVLFLRDKNWAILNNEMPLHFKVIKNDISYRRRSSKKVVVTPLFSYGFIALNVLIFLYEASLSESALTNFIMEIWVYPFGDH